MSQSDMYYVGTQAAFFTKNEFKTHVFYSNGQSILSHQCSIIYSTLYNSCYNYVTT